MLERKVVGKDDKVAFGLGICASWQKGVETVRVCDALNHGN